MQVWIASVIIIFALSQFWGWLSHTEFSLSVLGLAGLGLAIASNYDKRHSFPFWPKVAFPNPQFGSSSHVATAIPLLKTDSTQAVSLPSKQSISVDDDKL